MGGDSQQVVKTLRKVRALRADWQHLYDKAAWARMRTWQLTREPLCKFCLDRGITELATVADHIKAHKGDVRSFLNGNNLQSLCKTCHDGAKQREENRGYVIGCDVDGIPLDPEHHWNKKPN